MVPYAIHVRLSAPAVDADGRSAGPDGQPPGEKIRLIRSTWSRDWKAELDLADRFARLGGRPLTSLGRRMHVGLTKGAKGKE
jgi:hypothetical protein